ncbi:BQ2448_7400 [Microbotryum intermedium]|uniref:BQ2448_7400 protein n=1 Tax=Microbotryum intermedium TaxID=269621 RepID=A0A238FNL3_9BASI|nr:BQ2448_7400 [Microbotryum intermedium]
MMSLNRFALLREVAKSSLVLRSTPCGPSRIWGATSAFATSSIARAADENEKVGVTRPAEVEGPIAKRLHFVGDTLNQVKDAASKTIKVGTDATGQATAESEERLFRVAGRGPQRD